ncbi:hypothetical protein BDB00DRAFT_753678 [Zychaea mexicana]|uniref:uncharacterized protein n=1 Tax=Zychaea mexicana TaxID=64656 RepID=UPI0022FF2BAE|nr:uncharacterized protein BDB00DRAFT_753678 [Zychaea mexicana]KAI9499276.1 hypothetical protein BDB00DRAFT_753678 [Zychaea mexicana]
MDGSLTIQVRSPSMSETLTLTTERNASVRSLKRLIHTVHPKKPSINDQRIIFGGKLLNDADTLSRILEKTNVDSIPTFHLVVKPTPVAATTDTTTTTNPLPSSSLNHHEQPIQRATATSSYSQPLPQQQQQQQQAMAGYPPVLPGGYQVIALNGQYYLAPVLVPAFAPQQPSLSPASQQASQSYTSTPLFNQHQQQQFQYPRAPAAAQPVPQPQQQQQQQQQAGDRPPVFVHAQNQVQRATSVWLALKLIFILFILCQDASLERILFFHVVAFIFFLYQTGRLRFVIQRPQPQHQQGQGASASSGSSNAATRDQQQQQQQPATLLATLKRGAYTFVASLWPNYGHDARLAQALDNGQNDAVSFCFNQGGRRFSLSLQMFY